MVYTQKRFHYMFILLQHYRSVEYIISSITRCMWHLLHSWPSNRFVVLSLTKGAFFTASCGKRHLLRWANIDQYLLWIVVEFMLAHVCLTGVMYDSYLCLTIALNYPSRRLQLLGGCRRYVHCTLSSSSVSTSFAKCLRYDWSFTSFIPWIFCTKLYILNWLLVSSIHWCVLIILVGAFCENSILFGYWHIVDSMKWEGLNLFI